MSTQQAFTVVGGVIGAYFGSWQAGAAIGGAIGGIVDPVRTQGPRIGEAGTQTTQEGAPRPIVYGTACVSGNVIESGPLLKTYVEEEGEGKGGGPINSSEHCYRTYAVRICEGPIADVLRIWRNGKLVVDKRPGSPILKESDEWLFGKGIYLGDETQLPDPFLMQNLNNEDIPAYRGTAYMVCVFDDLTETAGAIAQYRFEVATAIAPATIGGLINTTTFPDVPVYWGMSIFAREDGSLGAGAVASLPINIPDGQYTLYKFKDDLTVDVSYPVTTVGLWDPDPDMDPFSGIYPQSYSETHMIGFHQTGGTPAFLSQNGNLQAFLQPDALSSKYWYSPTGAAAYEHDPRRISWSPTHIYMGVTYRNNITVNKVFRFPIASGGFPSYADAVISGASSGLVGGEFLTHLSRDGKYRILDGNILKTYTDGLEFETAETLSFLDTHTVAGFGFEGPFAVFVYWSPSRSIEVRNSADFSLIDTIASPGFSDDFNTKVIFLDQGCYVQCGRWIGRLQYSKSAAGLPAVLGDIVADIHQRCGALQYDVSELTDLVDGLLLAGDYTGADAINALRAPYFFDKAEPGDAIKYVKRGGDVVHTFTFDDLVEEPDQSQREQAIEYPRKIHLQYQLAKIGYDSVMATSMRSSRDAMVVGEKTLQVPVVLDETQAARIVAKLHKTAWEDANGEVKFSVPLQFLKYIPTNIVELSLRGNVDRLRIEQANMADGVIEFTCRHDRQSAYTSTVTGVVIPDPAPPPSTVIGDTLLAVLDIPSRVDAEDDLNLYVAVAGSESAWHGARVQRSLDGGANYATAADLTSSAVMGTLVDAIGAASAYFTDSENTVRVKLYRGTQVLEDITEMQFMTEAGAFAVQRPDSSWEILQYMDAADEGDGVFALSVLHRGQLNSGASAHLSGALFVMLRDVKHVAAQSGWIGRELTHRAVGSGTSAELAELQTETYLARSQTEWPVASLELKRVGSNITATWMPRHRFGPDESPVPALRFAGFRVTFDDGVLPPYITTTPDPFITFDATAYGPSVTVSVSALNQITGAGPATSSTI